MTKDELEQILQTEKVDPRSYSLDGGDADDTLCLGHEDGRWVVYYSERGKRYNHRWFSTESAACQYLLLKLRDLSRYSSRLPDAPRESS